MNNKQITISKGNAKMGAIPSVSLPACTTCNPGAPCFAKCYALKLSRRRATVAQSYAKNLEILKSDPAGYFYQIQQAATLNRFFRYHVSGDIPNFLYFSLMVDTAKKCPGTVFLAFTKQYQIVNEYIKHYGHMPPENLKIIFSNWGDWKCENPYNLPVCEIIFKGETPADDWKICGGNCSECACRGVGCWELKNGETIAIYEH